MYARHGKAIGITVELDRLALRDVDGARRVVADRGRSAYLKLHHAGHALGHGDEDLALVEARVGLLQVFDLRRIQRITS